MPADHSSARSGAVAPASDVDEPLSLSTGKESRDTSYVLQRGSSHIASLKAKILEAELSTRCDWKLFRAKFRYFHIAAETDQVFRKPAD